MTGILWGVLQNPETLQDVTPLFECGSPHHVTLVYGCEKTFYQDYIGKKFSAQSQLVCYNEQIQAISLHINDHSVICKNRIPHITISHCEGTAPAIANLMLMSDNFDCYCHQVLLHFKIEFFEWQT